VPPGLAQQSAGVALAVFDMVPVFDVREQQLRRPHLLFVTDFSGWVLEILEQLLAFIIVEFRRTARTWSVVGSLLDRVFLETIEPVYNDFLEALA
jgi:hypothetical protein